MGIGGTAKENILNYVPAIVYMMYDGYYIYSPTYVPKTITDSKGKQLFYYENGAEGKELTNSAVQTINGKEETGLPIYEAKENAISDSEKFSEGDETKTITFTTDVNSAKTTYKHVLKTFVPYTTIYSANGQNYVINYTLDNYVRIYGKNETWEGYIIEEYGSTKYEVPVNSTEITFNDVTIKPETLSENIAVKNSEGTITVENYKYIYNSSNDKRYYDNDKEKFFTVNSAYEKVYLSDVDVNHSLAEYKKLLIRPTENSPKYIELYQLLNDEGNTTWYYKDSTGKYVKYDNFTESVERDKDCSAINYYVENYLFNFWINDERLDADKILSLRKQSIIDNVNKNLNLAISNYSANSEINYTIPELTEADWEQALSGVSMITFFQGVKVGLKTYNNYSIVTSSENNEYVGEDSLYYIDYQDEFYHRYRCSSTQPNIGLDGVYKNVEFKAQSFEKHDGTIEYYYQHGGIASEGRKVSMLQCFDCIVNKNNMKEYTEEESRKQSYFEEAYNTGLARERYIQMQRTRITDSKATIVEENKVEMLKITKQPVTQTVALGKSATFTIEVTGGKDNQYQWYYKEGSMLSFSKISGATGNTYITDNLTESYDFGAKYYCIVTSSDGQQVQSNIVTTEKK